MVQRALFGGSGFNRASGADAIAVRSGQGGSTDRCPLLNSGSCGLERRWHGVGRKSLTQPLVTGTSLDERLRVDRELAPEIRRQDRRRRILQTAIPLLIVAVLLAWLPGWLRPTVSRARIRTARVTTGPIEAVIMASGTVAPEVERVLSSPLDARVLRLLQRPGAHLKRGDPVVELDVSESVLALDKVVKDLKIKDNQQAQARLTLEKSLVDLDGRQEVKALELQSAQARLDGDEQLFKEGLFSREALRRSELAVKQAQIELAQLRDERKNAERAAGVQVEGLALERGALDKEVAQARRLLDLSTTKSDRDGVLTWVVSQEGALVRRGDVIARIADLTSFRVDATVSDLHAGRLRSGMAAAVRVNDLDLPGTVTEVQPTVDNGVLRFTVALADPSHAGLRPNLRTDVLVITERKPRALRVKRGPFADNDARQAFVVRGDRAVRIPLTVGVAGLDDVELVSGASEGDEIIISDMKDYMHLSEVRIR
jgi:HlyD family secretion protein